jgi:hypothetical protein
LVAKQTVVGQAESGRSVAGIDSDWTVNRRRGRRGQRIIRPKAQVNRRVIDASYFVDGLIIISSHHLISSSLISSHLISSLISSHLISS